jgi:hypothetical protein
MRPKKKRTHFSVRFLLGWVNLYDDCVADGWVSGAVFTGFDVAGDVALEAGVGADFEVKSYQPWN